VRLRKPKSGVVQVSGIGRVVNDANLAGMPPVTSLVAHTHDGMAGDGYSEVLAVAGEVPVKDPLAREKHAAAARLDCYQYFGAAVPNGAKPMLTPRLAATIARHRARTSLRPAATCGSCLLELPATGVCSCSQPHDALLARTTALGTVDATQFSVQLSQSVRQLNREGFALRRSPDAGLKPARHRGHQHREFEPAVEAAADFHQHAGHEDVELGRFAPGIAHCSELDGRLRGVAVRHNAVELPVEVAAVNRNPALPIRGRGRNSVSPQDGQDELGQLLGGGVPHSLLEGGRAGAFGGKEDGGHNLEPFVLTEASTSVVPRERLVALLLISMRATQYRRYVRNRGAPIPPPTHLNERPHQVNRVGEYLECPGHVPPAPTLQLRSSPA
jgi:hypothetical protein